MALLILILAVGYLIHRGKKSALFLISIGSIFLLSFILYRFIPNPYEFTHLPEYAILSMLLVWALCNKKVMGANTKKEKRLTSVIIKNPYFLSGIITGLIRTVDEIYQYFLPNRYFTLYDIFLNILGGTLGLLILGIKLMRSFSFSLLYSNRSVHTSRRKGLNLRPHWAQAGTLQILSLCQK